MRKKKIEKRRVLVSYESLEVNDHFFVGGGRKKKEIFLGFLFGVNVFK